MSEVRCEIKQRLGVLSENPKTGWKTEANIVSWNGGPDKLDIRDWNPDNTRSGRGKTLTSDEAKVLKAILDRLFGGE